jgi:hypothetical protein
LVQCDMIGEQIVRDQRQIPRVSFLITEKGKTVLDLFNGW